MIKNKPVLYLPESSYFGDFNILNNLKSNIVFKSNQSRNNVIIYISKDVLLELCDLFPETSENLKRRSLILFMKEKNTNSKRCL